MTVTKPKSMPSGHRNILRPNDSASLWNATLSPGWTREESDIFRLALQKYGIGNWKEILESGCLPGKTNAQLNLQLQRLLGQQSTAEFQGLHVDPVIIGEHNAKKTDPSIKRKNGCIVNTGGKLKKDELQRKIQLNKETFEMPESEWTNISVPTLKAKARESDEDETFKLIAEKRQRLEQLKTELLEVEQQIQERLIELGQ